MKRVPTGFASKVTDKGEGIYSPIEGTTEFGPLYFNTNISLINYTETLNKIVFSNLNISFGTVMFENLIIYSRILISQRARLTMNKCTILPYKNIESAIECMSSSSLTINDSIFPESNGIQVVAREKALLYINNSIFYKSEKSNVIGLDSSFSSIDNCTFVQANKMAIYFYKNSCGNITNCTFEKDVNKGIFILHKSKAYVENCSFNQCQGNAITAGESSEVTILDCRFNEVNCGAFLVKDSVGYIDKCVFSNLKGNGIKFFSSTGFVSNSSFSGFSCPAIISTDQGSNPVIYNCDIINTNVSALAARNLSRMLICNSRIFNSAEAVSASDFAEIEIRECVIANLYKFTVVGFNASKISLINSKIDTYTCKLSTNATSTLISDNSAYIKRTDLSDLELNIPTYLMDKMKSMNFIPEGLPANLPKIKWNEYHEEICSHHINHEHKCMLCHNNCDAVFSPCGHRVYCHDCVEKLKKERSLNECPVCSSAITSSGRVYDEFDVCSICLTNDADTICLPCGHKCMCFSCAMILQKEKRGCPICQTPCIGEKFDFCIDPFDACHIKTAKLNEIERISEEISYPE